MRSNLDPWDKARSENGMILGEPISARLRAIRGAGVPVPRFNHRAAGQRIDYAAATIILQKVGETLER